MPQVDAVAEAAGQLCTEGSVQLGRTQRSRADSSPRSVRVDERLTCTVPKYREKLQRVIPKPATISGMLSSAVRALQTAARAASAVDMLIPALRER